MIIKLEHIGGNNRVDKTKEKQGYGTRGVGGLFRPLLMLPETQREECGLFLGPALVFSLTHCAFKHSGRKV